MTRPLDIDTYFQKETDERTVQTTFNFELINDILPKVELFTEEEKERLGALLALVLLSYIQAFSDGNKRTARITSNAILIANKYCPISFRTVDSVEYKKVMLIFYEQNNISAFKKIFIYSAYALVPYIVCTFIAVILSNVLIRDESIWIVAVQWLGMGWSIILMIQAMRAAHQYSFGKTLVSMVGTVIVMLLILFLAVLLISLFQQLYVFIYQIYTEILYRVRG